MKIIIEQIQHPKIKKKITSYDNNFKGFFSISNR